MLKTGDYFKEWFSPEQRVQRDLQLYFLSSLYEKDKNIIFKGGTAIDLFYKSGRFSEDLDFDSESEDALIEIDETIEELGKNTKYAIFNDWYRERFKSGNFIRYELKVSSPVLDELVNFIIDVTIDRPFYSPDNLLLKYGKSLSAVMVMKAEEMLAEKVSAILTRSKARDLYDVYVLAVKDRVHINAKDIYAKCLKKFSEYDPKPYSFDLFKKRINLLKSGWKELDPLLISPRDYPFETVSKEVIELFKGI